VRTSGASPRSLRAHGARYGSRARTCTNLLGSDLNQTTKDWHTRVVTLNAVKGLAVRFFAEFILSEVEGLRMTRLDGHVVKCTKVVCFDLVQPVTIVHVLLTIATTSSCVFLMVASTKAIRLPLRNTLTSPHKRPLATGFKPVIFNSSVVASFPFSSVEPNLARLICHRDDTTYLLTRGIA
jgi:hypothetical protein